MNLKNGKVFTSKFIGTGPLSYEKRIYRATVPQRLRNTGLESIAMTGNPRAPDSHLRLSSIFEHV